MRKVEGEAALKSQALTDKEEEGYQSGYLLLLLYSHIHKPLNMLLASCHDSCPAIFNLFHPPAYLLGTKRIKYHIVEYQIVKYQLPKSGFTTDKAHHAAYGGALWGRYPGGFLLSTCRRVRAQPPSPGRADRCGRDG